MRSDSFHSSFIKRSGLYLLAILLTRLPLLYQDLLQVDEAIFAVGTRVWSHGGIPYLDFVETKAMGIYYFYAFASFLTGHWPQISMIAVHALTLLWTYLTALTLEKMGTRFYSSFVGFWAAFFFILISANFVPNIVSTNMEVVLLLPWTLSVYFLLRDPKYLKTYHSFLAGFFFSAAFITKYQSGILLPIVGFYFWILLFLYSRAWRFSRAFVHSLFFSLGCIPLIAAMLLSLKNQNALSSFYFWNFQGSLRYIEAGNQAIHLGQKIITRALPYLASTALLWILVFQRLWNRFRKKIDLSPLQKGFEAFLILWFLLTWVPVCMGKRFYDHYFLLLFPSACLLAAASLETYLSRPFKKLKVLFWVLLILPSVGFTGVRYSMHAIHAKWGGDDMSLYRPYGEFIQQQTKAEDRVFVWGYTPAVYWYADRLPATRFMWSDLLSGRVPGIVLNSQTVQTDALIMLEAWDMLFEDFIKHPPELVVDMAPTGLHDYIHFPISRFSRLQQYLDQHYVLYPSFQNALVWKRKNIP
ncbi:MAG: hypothetical protein JNK65_09560 [Deltaproteobacteria bacterium]|nr:hypothetical protein [Deltaproteobacteria bacterium]